MDSARRELLEETGYTADKLISFLKGPISPGLCTEVVTFFRAIGLKKVASGGGDESEDITVHEVLLDEADAWLEAKRKTGVLIDPKMYAGLYFARQEA